MGANRTGPEVAILVSTYNGERYLSELFDSLFQQSYHRCRIYVRDDGSRDGTGRILQDYAGERIMLMVDDLGNLGPARSFLQLIRIVHADIYMCCDQDDVWNADKVARAVAAIEAAGTHNPVLFHSDLIVVDQDLEPISPSFMQHEGIALPSNHRFRRLLVQNCVVGCTTAFTDELIRAARLRDVTPTSIAMHDWWLALAAACFGEIVYSPNAAILYRQHHANVSGASRSSLLDKLRRQFTAEGVGRINCYRLRIGRQAAAFLEAYSGQLPEDRLSDLRAVARLEDGAGIVGIFVCALRGIRLQRLYMNAGIILSSCVALISPLAHKPIENR